jgi:hypothetical protein
MSRRVASFTFLSCLAISFSLGGYAQASIWYDGNPAVKPGIPDTGWVSTDPKLDGGYCGYVAATNVIRYWQNHGMPNLVASGRSDDQLMSDLIGSSDAADPTYHRYLYQTGTIPGTTCNEVETGLRNYFTDKGYGNRISIHQYSTTDITLRLIQDELKACEQLILGLDTPAHWLTVAGWMNVAGSPWLGVHDPNPLQPGGANLGKPEDYYQTRQDADQTFHLNYGNLWGIVDNLVSVSQVPEPATVIIWLLLGTFAITFGWRRKQA